MVENKSSLLGIIALIIGASGLGIGTFSIVNFQVVEGPPGPPGEDGEDLLPVPHIYYCSSQIEVQEALYAISSGIGIIYIIQDIDVTSSILIDGGGSYVIQGLGITINVIGDTDPLRITNATSCTIRDLVFHETMYSTWDHELIYISEISNNPVHIENVHMYCTSGTGIFILSDNVFVSDCSFNNNFRAVYTAGEYTHIYHNTAHSCSSGVQSYGVFQLSGDNNILEGNTVIGTIYSGSISCIGDNNVIANNIIERPNENAIKIFDGANNSVSGNVIRGEAHYIDEGAAFTNPLSGIFVANTAHYTCISGNYIVNMRNTHGSYDGHGVYIWTGCEYTSIIGNTIINNDVNITNNGLYTMIEGNIA
jgi:hypothetical protein